MGSRWHRSKAPRCTQGGRDPPRSQAPEGARLVLSEAWSCCMTASIFKGSLKSLRLDCTQCHVFGIAYSSPMLNVDLSAGLLTSLISVFSCSLDFLGSLPLAAV